MSPTEFEILSEMMKELKDAFLSFRQECRDCYVTKDAFIPVRAIAYGLVGAVTLAVLSAILVMVMK